MDSKLLMLGDWVMYNPNVFIEDEYEPSKEWEKTRILSGEDIDLADEDCYEPIPLTTEILEKNGWKEAQFWHEYQDGKNTIQSCLPDIRGIINGVEIQHFKCEYVHQYQHLLRLCGLNELADNFKV